MMTDDTHQDLTALFAAEDDAFDAAPFVEDVMAPIERHRARRRVVLAGAALMGGVIAGAQVPKLLAGSSDASAAALTSVQGIVIAAETMNPIGLAAIALIALCGFAITLGERA